MNEHVQALRYGRMLRQGQLLAYRTSTIPGITASAMSKTGMRRLQQFKQRRGPFVLLAEDIHSALRLARYYSPRLRSFAKTYWPGPVTLVFHAKPPRRTGLISACYHHGQLAVRVESLNFSRNLVHFNQGLIASSSLNRKGGVTVEPNIEARYRFHRWLGGVAKVDPETAGQASRIIRLSRKAEEYLR